MTLFLTNTLSGKKEEFKPIRESAVGMYNCGPTVYNYAHIGNLRAFLMADLLKRTLEWNGYAVKQVMNITDVGHLADDADEGEDKVEKAARENGSRARDITEFFAKAFFEDLRSLNANMSGTLYPRATEHILEQIALIAELEKKGYTYEIGDGVYFDTSKFTDYGKLGNINLEGLREAARVEKNAEKRNPTDFALWKFSKATEKRQQEWVSPWGRGFPGWHVECSAMSMRYLGATFDIHTGGIDHIPVHHNNEIAQSEAATGVKYVNYWLHNAFVNVDGGKMAKSAGNFIRLATLIDAGIHPLSFRYFVLSAHYSTQLNYTAEAIAGAQAGLEGIIREAVRLNHNYGTRGTAISTYLEEFTNFINDDLDTPKALALVHALLADASLDEHDKLPTLLAMDKVLGLDIERLVRKMGDIPADIMELYQEREEARAEHDWAKSDSIRGQLEERGYELRDYAKGSIIEKRLGSLVKPQ